MPDFLAAGPRDMLVPESGAQAAREALLRRERVLRARAAVLDEDRLAGFAGDRADLFRGALELGVGEHGRALEGQFALQLDPGVGPMYSSLTLTVTGRGMR